MESAAHLTRLVSGTAEVESKTHRRQSRKWSGHQYPNTPNLVGLGGPHLLRVISLQLLVGTVLLVGAQGNLWDDLDRNSASGKKLDTEYLATAGRLGTSCQALSSIQFWNSRSIRGRSVNVRAGRLIKLASAAVGVENMQISEDFMVGHVSNWAIRSFWRLEYYGEFVRGVYGRGLKHTYEERTRTGEQFFHDIWSQVCWGWLTMVPGAVLEGGSNKGLTAVRRSSPHPGAATFSG